MDAFRELLACPACGGDLLADWSCAACAAAYGFEDGVARLARSVNGRTEAVRRFYAEAPFPAYPEGATLTWLRARAERSPFPRLLDRAIPADARVCEVGCGTGQMSLYLARAGRLVVGADLSLASLRLAAAAAERFGVERTCFVECDLHGQALRRGAFDVVYCSGVLHHTPRPEAAFTRVAGLAKPGGLIVLGLYNAAARLPLRLRRGAARLSGFRWIPFDPVLRDRRNEPDRRRAWLRDQYQHPEEHRHTIGEVLRWFRQNEVDYIRAYPTALLHEEAAEAEDLLATQSDAWPPERWLVQLGWMASLGREGGLFAMIGRRRASRAEHQDAAPARESCIADTRPRAAAAESSQGVR